MFPSGQWTGHWDQNGMGRQDMHDLTLRFRNEQLEGEGWDCVGRFTLSGTVLPGNKVQITKKYERRHSVVYLGEHDGEGTISGAWALFGDNGTFALRPVARFHGEEAPIQDLQF